MKQQQQDHKLDEYLQQAGILHRTGQLNAAENLYRKLLKQHPKHPQILSGLGTIALQTGHPVQAVALLGKSLKADSSQAHAHNNQGIALLQLQRLAEAEACFRQAIRHDGLYLQAYNNLGNVLHDQHQHQAAIAEFDKAIALNPNDAESYCFRGNVLLDLKRFAEALRSFDMALTNNPAFAEAYYNRANTHKVQLQLTAAQADYEQALRLRPNYIDAMWNLALLKLLSGDFANGWRLYESRLQGIHQQQQRNFPQPVWLGDSPLENQVLLVHAEQGAGDVLQFCRYLPSLANLPAQLLVEVPKGLKNLLSSLDQRLTILERGQKLPAFDVHCPLMSLPLALKTTLQSIPADTPYLHVDPDKQAFWQQRLGKKQRMRVGLAWSGSKTHSNDKNRSIPLQLFKPLQNPALEFHCLQSEIRAEDQQYLAQFAWIHPHHSEIKDFTDTAALIAEMDLVISVDTAVAHLAGALAKPLWLLLPYVPDFRWLLQRTDSPWYPGAHLFRQPAIDDWQTPLAELLQKLQHQAAVTRP